MITSTQLRYPARRNCLSQDYMQPTLVSCRFTMSEWNSRTVYQMASKGYH